MKPANNADREHRELEAVCARALETDAAERERNRGRKLRAAQRPFLADMGMDEDFGDMIRE